MKGLQDEKVALELQVSSLSLVHVRVSELEKALEEAKLQITAEERRRKEAESVQYTLREELNQAKQ